MATIGFHRARQHGRPDGAQPHQGRPQLKAFDVVQANVDAAAKAGSAAVASAADAARGVDIVVSMLPAGQHVRDVYMGAGKVIASAAKGTLLIDCSTIDVDTARAVSAAASAAGHAMIDAPVSGGTVGAEAGTLTFMVGGERAAFDAAEPILQAMGKTSSMPAPPGNGQAAKICNNIILGISMIAVCEGFVLARSSASTHRNCSTSAPNPRANAGR